MHERRAWADAFMDPTNRHWRERHEVMLVDASKADVQGDAYGCRERRSLSPCFMFYGRYELILLWMPRGYARGCDERGCSSPCSRNDVFSRKEMFSHVKWKKELNESSSSLELTWMNEWKAMKAWNVWKHVTATWMNERVPMNGQIAMPGK